MTKDHLEKIAMLHIPGFTEMTPGGKQDIIDALKEIWNEAMDYASSKGNAFYRQTDTGGGRYFLEAFIDQSSIRSLKIYD